VSGKAYLEAIGEQVVSGFSQNAALAEQMRKMFATFESAYPSDPGQTERPVPQFVHLQNALLQNRRLAGAVQRGCLVARENLGDQWDCHWDIGRQRVGASMGFGSWRRPQARS
jgi:hypothetical protein